MTTHTVIEEVSDPQVLGHIFRLRVEAWRTHLNIGAELSIWRDPVDDVARHWALFVHSELAAAARLSVHDSVKELPDAEVYANVLLVEPVPIAVFSRCVVHPSFRGRGFASMLDSCRIAAAKQIGCGRAVVSVFEYRRWQLEAAGFEEVGVGRPYGPDAFLAGIAPIIFQINF